MTKVLWKTALVNPADAQAMAAQVGVPEGVARWLCARGIPRTGAKEWLQPDPNCYSSPLVFTDMQKAVERIQQAVTNTEKVGIVGDYDVDGVTASSILASALTSIGAQWVCDIPHRIYDGYGLSSDIVMRLRDQGVTLLVTVDNGIRSIEAVEVAQKQGIDVIVTDHHEPGDDSPASAVAVIHWSRTQDGAQVTHLSGAGVALKLSEALLTETNSGGITEHVSTVAQTQLSWLKGLAALGALADVMPMTVENRLLIREGLQGLQSAAQPGWLALCSTAGLNLQELTDRTLLWRITPRLNAAGRMDSANLAFELLMADNPVDAEQKAQAIEALNSQRRSETDKSFRAAKALCQELEPLNPAGYVVAGPWPPGVVGIVAARLVDEYHKPVIVLADNEDGTMKGSGRAPEGLSLYQATEQCEDYLTHFGGHDAAIGCGLKSSSFASFQSAFAAACKSLVDSGRENVDEEETELMADDFLPLAKADLDTVDWVEAFAPYGPGNPPLQFYVGPLEIISVSMVGNSNQHARIRASEGDATATMIWFNAAEWIATAAPGTQISAVVELEANTWRGTRRAQLRVVSAQMLNRALTRRHFGVLYKLLRARRQLRLEDAAEILPEAKNEEVRVMLDAFVELGFAQCRESAYHVVEHTAIRDLRESRQYHDHLREAIRL